MTISSPGIGSGLDVNSIISQLMAIERKPLDALVAKQTAIQAQISEYGKLKSAMSAMRDAALKLSDHVAWGASTGVSGNAAAVGVSVKSGAATGSYTVEVLALAKAQSLASATYASSAALPGAGPGRGISAADLADGLFHLGETPDEPVADHHIIDRLRHRDSWGAGRHVHDAALI